MNNFPAMTEEQRAELVQFNRAIIAQHESYAVSEAGWPDDVRLLVSSARIALAALTAEKRLTVCVVQKNERLKGFNFEGYDSLPAGEHEFYTAPPAPALRVPDGWIKCSEKMPGVFDAVITSDGKSVNICLAEASAKYRYFTSILSGREVEVTHWMPLPPPPETSNEQ
ncbi:DUF551 domain-containing protein [uncultured Pantoea sp.]|uniref:DUF551 domain-containing protein n=1 Tax=uncultured Pantoea sp. TaxID=218084 RepID=UPI00258CE02F|nr:DUF551 domain-containing protein [uncultured Pantoea sp.]